MITTLDQTSWAPNLVNGGAQFVEYPNNSDGTLYIVSNVRALNTLSGYGFGGQFGNNYGAAANGFVILKSTAVPPAPGPGSSFTTVASYNFPQPNLDFDPVVALDAVNGLLHILGTRSSPTGVSTSSNQLSDLVKFTYNINTQVLSGPLVINTSARLRNAYDIAVLQNSDWAIAYLYSASPGIAESLIVAEYTMMNSLVSSTTLLSYPNLSSNTFDAVSLVTQNNNLEVYYESHPRIFTFSDQIFSINVIYRTGGAWGSAVNLTSFSGRYADNRLTVIADAAGNRYLSQTYWTQQNHPEGIIGNVLLGYASFPTGFGTVFGGNFGEAADLGFGYGFGFDFNNSYPAYLWNFRSTLGSTLGGSIIQSTLAVDENTGVSLAYLLQPFDQIPVPPSAVSWPFHVASVSIPSLGLTESPGFYNSLNFTWLRGTKSLMDNSSEWAIVGENEILTQTSESKTIPLTLTPTVILEHASTFEGSVSVVYSLSSLPLSQVFTNSPAQGQYYVETSTGEYIFNTLDGGASVLITYNYVSGILPVYASLFNVPPIAELTPTSAVVWRGGTYYATDVSSITSFSINNGVVTVVANNDFMAGDEIAIYGFQDVANQFFNGNTLTVLSTGLSSTSFEAYFSHANYTFFSGEGFGNVFGNGFGGNDYGFAAVLIPGKITLDACGSYSPNSDPLTYSWTNNYKNQADITTTTSVSGCSATLLVNPLIGGNAEKFDVGVAVLDLAANPPHEALMPTNFSINENLAAFTVSNTLIAGEQVMPYNLVLAPPPPPEVVSVSEGFGYDFGNYFSGTQYYFTITYVNSLGETTSSTETSYITTGVPVIQSPPASGDATSYNVYASTISGEEQLQFNSAGVLLPTPLGTNWALSGELIAGINSPSTNTAYETFLNDIVLTLESSSSTGFTAAPALGVSLPNLPATSIMGYVLPQYQFQTTSIFVPQNINPTIIFPAPNWNSPPSVNVPRNTQITITPNYPLGSTWSSSVVYEYGANVIYSGITYNSLQNDNVGNTPSSSPLYWGTSILPVVITGLNDPDDVPVYQWQQLSGTTVTTVNTSQATFVFSTNGVNMNGEALVFSLTISDGVNSPVTQEFTVNVAAYDFNPNAKDVLQLSRSIYSSSATVTNVSIFEGIGIITALNNFTPGQTVFFSGMQNATFLNDTAFNILSTGFGQSYGGGFGGQSITSTQFTISSSNLPNYTGVDTGKVYAAQPIAQRNAYLQYSSVYSPTVTYTQGSKVNYQEGTYISLQNNNTGNLPATGFGYNFGEIFGELVSPPYWATVNLEWSPLDISVIYNNLQSVKRLSILDGSDRYIVISPYSVLVYGIFPFAAPAAVLLRRLFLPNGATILDAVHTEQDYTLVIDSLGNIWRYSTAPFINTDNPDTQIILNDYTSLSFSDDVKILTTVSFNGQRVLVICGEQGALLMQISTQSLEVLSTLTLDVASNLVFGASKVQFVRWVNTDSLRSGKVLLGTILNQSAMINSISFNVFPDSVNTLRITCKNNFTTGDVVVLSGLTNAPELNGLVCEVIEATTSYFLVSYQPPAGSALLPSYGLTADTGLVQSQNSGSTYETLIDLSAGQITGTFDKSKLRNQFVQTGEILFDPDDTYAGGPSSPVMLIPTKITVSGQSFVQVSWQQLRPDLITSYTVQYAVDNLQSAVVPSTSPYIFQALEFTADEGVYDLTQGFNLTSTTNAFPAPGQYNVSSTGLYTFNFSQAGHNLIITSRDIFQNLEIVNSGNVQTIYATLPAGRTYFFQVQASGLDGTSAWSNIQKISI